jgi:glycosyltransferase involved in cell wall biosynthesis
MPRPLVTIISPTYNQERYVAECIESALAQTYPDWEQILVDDGSTDATRDVVARYQDPRIRLLALPHRGLSALADSYNAALAASRGSLIGVLEGDDAWPADKLERQVPLFDDPRALISWGRGTIIDAHSRPTGVQISLRERGPGPTMRIDAGAAFHRLTHENLFVPSVTVMLRRSALDTIGGFKQTGSALFVDLPTWLWLTATQPGHVTFLDQVLGHYRHHDRQTSQLRSAEMTLEHLRVVLGVEESLGAAVMERIGWDDSSRRGALARGKLVQGKIELATGRFDEAYASYRDAWRLGADPSRRWRAMRGMASSAGRLALRRIESSMRRVIER